jgi:hypothetical protein
MTVTKQLIFLNIKAERLVFLFCPRTKCDEVTFINTKPQTYLGGFFLDALSVAFDSA